MPPTKTHLLQTSAYLFTTVYLQFTEWTGWILADEPTGELDSKTTRELLTFFRQLVEQQHITMLMVSHDPLVDSYVHQVLNLKDGVVES